MSKILDIDANNVFELEEKVLEFVAEAANLSEDEVGLDDRLVEDLGIDSLGMVGIFIDLAFDFKIKEPERDEDWRVYNTPKRIIEFARLQMELKS